MSFKDVRIKYNQIRNVWAATYEITCSLFKHTDIYCRHVINVRCTQIQWKYRVFIYTVNMYRTTRMCSWDCHCLKLFWWESTELQTPPSLFCGDLVLSSVNSVTFKTPSMVLLFLPSTKYAAFSHFGKIII